MACFPNILGNNKSAIDKQREMVRMQGEGKYTAEDVENARIRAETLSYGVQAEMNHVQYYRVDDFTNYMKTFIDQQIVFYQSIVSKLQETAQKYESNNSWEFLIKSLNLWIDFLLATSLVHVVISEIKF